LNNAGMRLDLRRLVGRVRLRPKLVFFTATATTAVLAATAFLTLRFFHGQLLEVVGESCSNQSDALRVVLEEQMTAGDRKLLHRMVGDIGREPHIAWVAVLDHEGRVRVSSDPRAEGRLIDKSSPDCRVCHEQAPAERVRSATLLRPAGDVLRTVTPLMNGPACHRCHGSERRLNGVLIVDRSLDSVQKTILSTRTQVVAGSAAALFALLASLGLAFERLVLVRLHRLRKVARELGSGNLAARSSDRGSDEMSELAQDVNAMAQGLSAALAGLAAERQQLDELVNGISDGLVLVDLDLKVVTTNRAFAARLPPALLPAPGSSYPELARAAGWAPADGSPPLAQKALGSGRLEKAIVRVGAPAGDRFEEIYAQPLRGSGGAPSAVIEVWRDITDRMALEAGLEQSERLAAIGMLASGVAHEVGNPLAAIATAVEGLLRRMEDGGARDGGAAEIVEYLEIVRKQVFRCRDVTERLLGFARLPSRQLTCVDAAAAAREVLALVSRQARSQNVEVRARLEAPAPAVAESLLLEQVFLNLVLNALQAMPGGGVLTVEARATADAVFVTVADTGPGIPEPFRRRLFEPFRRARPDGTGTGLGLFLSAALVRKCDGTLSVRSEPGKGAAFTVQLRSAAPGASRAAAER
jgi:signal transduction histidine kinase/HAMP domain-containing protein